MDTPEYPITREISTTHSSTGFTGQTRVPRWQIINYVEETHGRLSENEKQIVSDALRSLREERTRLTILRRGIGLFQPQPKSVNLKPQKR